MKFFVAILLCVFTLSCFGQDKSNVFHLVDAVSKKAIPYVSVSLVRSKQAMNTEQDGILTIPGDISRNPDTVIFSAQNYLTVKTQLYKLNGRDTLSLRPVVFQNSVNIPASITGKDSVLNDFNWHDVAYFAGLHTPTARFEYLQLAQLLKAPAPNTSLKKIFVCRLGRVLNYDEQSNIAGLETARFRLRIYDADKTTGLPGRDLCNEIIEVKNYTDADVSVDLNKYKITIPNEKFFVAIEWLRIYDNAVYAMRRDERNLAYKPTIGISPKAGGQLNIFGLTYAHKWEPFTYFSPFGTDLAIKATVVR